MRIGRSLALAAASILLGAAVPAPATAGHPLGTEDAATLGRGNVEVEFNGEGSRSGGGSEIQVGNAYTLGLHPRLDLAVSLAYLFLPAGDGTAAERGFGDTEATLKTSFHDGQGWVPGLGLKAGVLLPTGDEDRGLGDGRGRGILTAIADWEIDRFRIHANVGNETILRTAGGTARNTTMKASLAGEWEPRDGWSLVGEYLWQKDSGVASPLSELAAGVVAQVSSRVAFDLGMRWGLAGEGPDATWLAGLTLAFPGDRLP